MHIYIYICTRVCLCASAHREEGWNWSKLATTLSGSKPAVLSQTLSQIRSQILSQLRSQLAPGRHGLSNSGHYPIPQVLSPSKSGNYSLEEVLALSKSGKYSLLGSFALSINANCRIMRGLALPKSGTTVKCERWHYRKAETF